MPAKPILVTGSHRSGTTWVGQMIAASPGVVYIHEPFNLNYPNPGVCSAKFNYWFTYICDRNDLNYLAPIKRMVNFQYNLVDQIKISQNTGSIAYAFRENARFIKYRLTGARPLIKDPLAFFSAEWLASRFDMDVVAMIRHPAAFVSSVKAKNWTHNFDHFLNQPLLMENYLVPFESQIRKFAQEEQSVIDQAALLWNIIYCTLLQFKKKHPEWIFLRHEDISRNPLEGFEKLDDGLHLDYTEEVKMVIRAHSSPTSETGLLKGRTFTSVKLDSISNIWSWKTRLTPTEIERIKVQVQDISQLFYSEDEW